VVPVLLLKLRQIVGVHLLAIAGRHIQNPRLIAPIADASFACADFVLAVLAPLPARHNI
jgi:hypothetical protein